MRSTRAAAEPHRERADPVAAVALQVGDVLEHRDRERERDHEERERPDARRAPPPPVKCSATPRLTTTARTPVMHSEASSGKRLSRSGGSEYAAPTARPASTAPVSSAPCVSAERDRHDRARGDDPAAPRPSTARRSRAAGTAC